MKVNINKTIVELIVELTGESNVVSEMDLFDDLGFTSLTLVSLITSLCEKYDIDIFSLSDADLLEINTVEDVIKLFGRLVYEAV